jgi:hypothetical protein
MDKNTLFERRSIGDFALRDKDKGAINVGINHMYACPLIMLILKMGGYEVL